jgi:predicted nucleotidyltransferase
MAKRDLEHAVDAVHRYSDACFPDASLVLLCGSWARCAAHDDSDLDVVVLDPGMTDVLFQSVTFESWLIEVCALSPARVADLFSAGRQHRSAPVPHQVVDAIVVRGDKVAAQ